VAPAAAAPAVAAAEREAAAACAQPCNRAMNPSCQRHTHCRVQGSGVFFLRVGFQPCLSTGQTLGYSEPLVYFIVVADFCALFLKNGCVLDAPKGLKKSSMRRRRHHMHSKFALRDMQKSIFACFGRTKKDPLQHVFEKLDEAKKSQP